MENVYLALIIIVMAGLGILALLIITLRRKHENPSRRRQRKGGIATLKSDREESDRYSKQIAQTIMKANKVFIFTLDSFMEGNPLHMKEAFLMNENLNRSTRKQKNTILPFLSTMKKRDVDAGHFYAQVIDYQREISHSLHSLQVPLQVILEEVPHPFPEEEGKEIRTMVSGVEAFFNFALHIVKEQRFEELEELVGLKARIIQILHDIEMARFHKENDFSTEQTHSLLMKALNETRTLLVHAVSLVKAYRNFILVNREL